MILPNVIPPGAVKTSLAAGFVIVIGASLSYLGRGIRPPTPASSSRSIALSDSRRSGRGGMDRSTAASIEPASDLTWGGASRPPAGVF